MDQLNEGISIFELTKNLSLQNKKILLTKISLYDTDVDTLIKTFEDYHKLKNFVIESIPSEDGFGGKGTLSLHDNVLNIDVYTQFDSGFGLRSKNCEINIFNLSNAFILKLTYDITNEFSHIENENIDEPEDIDEINDSLIESFKNNDEYTFIKMLESGADNINDVMELAEENNNLNIIKILIEYGANNFDFILMKAANNNHIDIVNFMISYGADINKSFIEAIRKGLNNSILVLLKYEKIDINEGLFEASKNDHVDIIKLLLQNGASDINNSLRYASESGSINSVKFLLELGATDKYSLYEAVTNEHKKIVEILLEYGIRDKNVILEASEKENIDIVKILLIKDNFSIYQLNKALLTAINKSNSNIARLLILNGANNFNEALKLAKRRHLLKIISLIELKI